MPYRSGPQPQQWCTGPDPERHARFIAWQRARAQANHRGETWCLTFTQYEDLWGDLWSRRGRGSEDLIMMRRDWHGAWDTRNTIIADRRYYSWQLAQIKLERGLIHKVHCAPGLIYREKK